MNTGDRKTKVLFLDDEQLLLQAFQRMLRPMRGQWDMTFVDNAESALAILADEPFDVVVSDIVMPGMNGAQFLAEVQKRHPETIRLVLSGHADPSLISQCIGAAHQFIAKPCDSNALRGIILRAAAPERRLLDEGLRTAVSRLRSLPALPSLYAQMVEALRSPDAGIDEIAGLVARDIGMTANILKLVNSAFFGLPRQISNVGEAVSFLGVDTLKHLTLCLDVFGQYQKRSVGPIHVEALWEHSMTVASSAKRLAQLLGMSGKLADEVFAAGMLHDAGKLILAAHDPASYEKSLHESNSRPEPLWLAEARHFHTDHASVAGYLLGLWGLPPPVVDAVSFHHSPSLSTGQKPDAATVLHLADAVSQTGNAQADELLDREFLRSVGLDDSLKQWRALTK